LSASRAIARPCTRRSWNSSRAVRAHCARDLTRGGLGGALCELAEAAGRAFQIDEAAIPVEKPVRGACELLGFDPLFVANEGCAAVFVADGDADAALAVLRRHPATARATRIGPRGGRRGVSARTALGPSGAVRLRRAVARGLLNSISTINAQYQRTGRFGFIGHWR
jgi:hydrogenase maturation factor